jgi:hypothetical protein
MNYKSRVIARQPVSSTKAVQKKLVVKFVKAKLFVSLAELFVINQVVINDDRMKMDDIGVVEGEEVVNEPLVLAQVLIGNFGPLQLTAHPFSHSESEQRLVDSVYFGFLNDQTTQYHEAVFGLAAFIAVDVIDHFCGGVFCLPSLNLASALLFQHTLL